MNQLLSEFKKMDTSIVSLMKSGIKFSGSIIIFSNLLLLVYDYIYAAPIIYHIGISLFKTSLFFIVGFIICAFAFHRISKELKKK